MSRESKIMSAVRVNTQTLVSHYEAFGWELLSINGNQVAMSRETQNPVYPELVKHQAAYEEAESEYLAITTPKKPTKPTPIDPATCLWFTLLAIFPVVIYLVVKFNEKNAYEQAMQEYNAAVAECNRKRQEILAKMDQIVLESRTIFFSRQS